MLQYDLSGTDFLALENERDLTAGANGVCPVVRFGCKRFDEFLIVTINRSAVARGRVLRQVYPNRLAHANVHRPSVIAFGYHQHCWATPSLVTIACCAGSIHESCSYQRNY